MGSDMRKFFAIYKQILPIFVIFFAYAFLPGISSASGPLTESQTFHTVTSGETLTRIARQYFPLTEALNVQELVENIRQLNGLQGSFIRPDQRLKIPLVRSSPVRVSSVPKAHGFEAKGVYVNRYSASCRKLTQLADQLIAAGGNTVILDAKDMSGKLAFPSNVSLAREIGASNEPVIEEPAKLFYYLRKKGLHIVARIVLFYDPILAAQKPEFALRSPLSGAPLIDHGKAAWVDPSVPAVQDYNLEIAKELAKTGVDEIQFDYIRFPTKETAPSLAHKGSTPQIPRHRIITDFLAKARRELSPYQVLLSIDVFAIMAWLRPQDLEMTGQKIEDLARHCDVLSPMVYPSHFFGSFQGIPHPGDHPFFFVSETCRRFSKYLEGTEVILRPWVQGFPLGARNYDDQYILEELGALTQSRATGWLFWSAGNSYDDVWKALAKWNQDIVDF
jgi:hypothetical protein